MRNPENSSLTPAPPTMQVNDGVEKYESGSQWPADCIIAERVKNGHKQFLMRWHDYDHTYDTWEYATELLDRSLEVDFSAKVSGIRHEVWLFRHYLAHAMVHTRGEKGDVKVLMPGIHGAAAHSLLRFLARPPSRVGADPIPVDESFAGSRKASSVTLPALDDIAWAVLGQIINPDKAFGSLLFCKGRSHDTDMLFAGPKFVIECAAAPPAAPHLTAQPEHACFLHNPSTRAVGRYSEPRPRQSGLFVEGPRTFKVKLNIWRVIGADGEVRGEVGMPNESFKKPIGEHIKNMLRGRKAWGLEHPLQENWAQLPAGQLVLSNAAALPACAPKRARAEGPRASVKMAKLA